MADGGEPRGPLVFSTSPEARFHELNQQVRLLGPQALNINVRKTVLRDNVQARAQYDVCAIAVLTAIQVDPRRPPEGVPAHEWASKCQADVKHALGQLQEAMGWSMARCQPQGRHPIGAGDLPPGSPKVVPLGTPLTGGPARS